ncbi:tRNA (adenosine(37)-N6)-dimethylallyltransferase MiaA [Halomonas denitrificans]|nr:tRNA (adenosine(37)-N6)-dimethylallyltransferase MiaA [Halomonas denitrificans]
MALAEAFPCRLISVDSAQVYRGMDIGTAKPTADELARFPHDLIDIRDPEHPYSAADFVCDARRCMEAAHAAGRLPVLVGGTTMYLKALRYGLDALPAADAAVRARLESEAGEAGWAALHARLLSIDPIAGRRIRPTDPQRIVRALEIHELTGRAPSSLWTGRGADRMRESLMIVLTPADRSRLHERIDRRWSSILAAGLLREVEALLRRPGLDPDGPVLRAVGYRQAVQRLRGEFDDEGLVRRGAGATRRLAKRQLTALRQWTGARWYDPLNPATIDRIIRRTGRFAASLGMQ